MEKNHADLHVHSTCSDGVHTPTELVRMASEIGLAGLALTDHDTVDGIQEFLKADGPDSLERVPGVEISTEHRGSEVHLLGYFVPTDSLKLSTKLKKCEEARKVRFPKMIAKLREIGIDIQDREIQLILRGVQSPGRPHVARLLIRQGVVKDFKEAFQRFLVPGKPAYIKKERMETIAAIKLLRQVSAPPVMAHPLVVRTDDLRGLLLEFKAAGLAGVESHYDYSQIAHKTAPIILEHAVEGLGLIETGGSDYHGDSAHDTLGRVTVPMEIIEQLRESAENG